MSLPALRDLLSPELQALHDGYLNTGVPGWGTAYQYATVSNTDPDRIVNFLRCRAEEQRIQRLQQQQQLQRERELALRQEEQRRIALDRYQREHYRQLAPMPHPNHSQIEIPGDGILEVGTAVPSWHHRQQHLQQTLHGHHLQQQSPQMAEYEMSVRMRQHRLRQEEQQLQHQQALWRQQQQQQQHQQQQQQHQQQQQIQQQQMVQHQYQQQHAAYAYGKHQFRSLEAEAATRAAMAMAEQAKAKAVAEAAAAENQREEDEEGFDDAVDDVSYTTYKPKKLKLGLPHPDPVVENASMAAVDPPELWYRLKLQDLEGEFDVVKSGKLSSLQLEAIAYACQAHETRLPDGSRAGFFIGDGAGVGKGRQLAGMMLENFLQGRRKHVWISVGNDLAFDARRDLDDLGCGGRETSSSSSEDDDSEDDSGDESEGSSSSGKDEDLGSRRLRSAGVRRARLRRRSETAANRKEEEEDLDEGKEGSRKMRKRKREHKENDSTKVGGAGLGGVFIDSFQQNKHAYGTIRDGDGVMFLTYSSLVAANRDGKSRLKQLLKWCGKDFDGCILFDECHRAKNLYAAGGSAPTKAGAAVVELQEKLPNARVVYCSATGASEPRNLGYMIRLGLWGAPGSPFPGGFKDFLTAVEGRGVGAMELVAMHLKQGGSFVCRTLSFRGCSFELVSDVMAEDMEDTYNEAAAFWQLLKRELARALSEKAEFVKRTGVQEEDLDLSSDDEGIESDLDIADDSDTESLTARRRHRLTKGGVLWRYFWGAHQRFFRDLCIASKVPATIDQAKQALDQGKCVVIGLQSTGEASMDAALKARGQGAGGAGDDDKAGGAAAETTSTDYISAPQLTLVRVIKRCFPLPPRPRALREQERENERKEIIKREKREIEEGLRANKRACRAGVEKKGMYREKGEDDVIVVGEGSESSEDDESSSSDSEDSSVDLDDLSSENDDNDSEDSDDDSDDDDSDDDDDDDDSDDDGDDNGGRKAKKSRTRGRRSSTRRNKGKRGKAARERGEDRAPASGGDEGGGGAEGSSEGGGGTGGGNISGEKQRNGEGGGGKGRLRTSGTDNDVATEKEARAAARERKKAEKEARRLAKEAEDKRLQEIKQERYDLALERQKRLLSASKELQLPGNPLDQLVNELGGVSDVAEMTGRKGRMVKKEDGEVMYEKRNLNGISMTMQNVYEKECFMSGQKLVAIISEAASAGISLQADRRVKNQRPRVHITMELPWSADKAVQQLGRSHRSNQSSAPSYKLLLSSVGGERRFASSVSRRLESLGALTQGDRRSSGAHGLGLTAFNIDTKYGRLALEKVLLATSRRSQPEVVFPELPEGEDTKSLPLVFEYEEADLIAGYQGKFRPVTSSVDKNPSRKVTPEEATRAWLVEVGLDLPRPTSSENVIVKKIRQLTDVGRFLNRLLGLEISRQAYLFQLFSDTLDSLIMKSRAEGGYDEGICEIKGRALAFNGDPEIVHESTLAAAPLSNSKKKDEPSMKERDGDEEQGEQQDSDKAVNAGKKLVMSTLRYNIQVDRGVPFSMASSLKERADEAASAETERLEAKEASIKKTCKDEVKEEGASSSVEKEGGKKRKVSKNPEAKARRKALSGIKSNLGRLKRRVDGFWYSRLPFSGASGFRRRVLLAMEKDVASLGVATDRIRVYRPLTGAKDYSRAKLRESYERVSVDKARGLWSEEFSGERNDVRFKHFVVLAGSVLPVWQKVEEVLNATPHTTAEQRLRIVRATEKEDEWGNGDDESGEGGVSGKTEGVDEKSKEDNNGGGQAESKKGCEICGGCEGADEESRGGSKNSEEMSENGKEEEGGKGEKDVVDEKGEGGDVRGEADNNMKGDDKEVSNGKGKGKGKGKDSGGGEASHEEEDDVVVLESKGDVTTVREGAMENGGSIEERKEENGDGGEVRKEDLSVCKDGAAVGSASESVVVDITVDEEETQTDDMEDEDGDDEDWEEGGKRVKNEKGEGGDGNSNGNDEVSKAKRGKGKDNKGKGKGKYKGKGKLLVCSTEECGRLFHMGCLKPPLARVPKGDWVCPVCRKREAHLAREAKAKVKREEKRKELEASRANKAPARTVKLEATDGPRNIIGIMLPERSAEMVCDALRGFEAELEKERAQLEMKAREEKEKTKEMEEEKRRLQIAREEKRKKLREEAASEKAKKGGHDSHDGEESDEGGAGTASEAVAELDEHGNFTGDLELLMHRSGSRAAKKNALQQIKKDAGGGGQQSKGKGKGAGGTRGKDVVADKDENELSRDKDEDEDGDVGQRSRRRRRNEDEAEEKEKPGKGMGKGKGKEEERKKGGDRGGSNKKGIGKDDEDAEEDLEEEEGEEEEDDEDDSPCLVCGGMGDPTKALLCDSCDSCYHMYCLTPPLKRAPKGDWHCPECTRKRSSSRVSASSPAPAVVAAAAPVTRSPRKSSAPTSPSLSTAQAVTRAAASSSESSAIPSKRRGVDQMKGDGDEKEEEDRVQVKADQEDDVIGQGGNDEEVARKAAEQRAMRLAALAVLDEGWDDDVGKVSNGGQAEASGEETESDTEIARRASMKVGLMASVKMEDGIEGEDEEREDHSEGDEEEADVCLVCGLDTNPEKLVRCSRCYDGESGMGVYHYDCLKNPLTAKPKGEWLCPRCTNKRRASSVDLKFSSPKKKKINGIGGGGAAGSPSLKKPKEPESEGRPGGMAEEEAGSDPRKVRREKTIWTESQEALLAMAVGKLGAGKWKEMVKKYDFEGKPSKVLKDKWRNLSKKVSSS